VPTQGQTVIVGGKRSKVSGRTRRYNSSGQAPCCCGGEGPGTWPTSGWIVGTPCPLSVGADKPVIMRASDLTTSPLWTGTGLPFTCFTEKFYNSTLGQEGCATFTTASTVLTLTEAQASSGDYYQATTTSGLGYEPFDCCSCTDGLFPQPCESGGYTAGEFEIPGNAFNYANIPVTFAIPSVKESWAAGAGCVYRCCCPVPGSGRTESHDLLVEYEGHVTYAPGHPSFKQFDEYITVSGSGTLAAAFDQITYGSTRTVSNTLLDDSVTGGTTTSEINRGFENCRAHCVSTGGGVPKAPDEATGTITISCDSFSMSATWDYFNVAGDRIYGSITMIETITRSGDCSAQCANAAGCVSGAAMFALIGDMLYEA
jgi:hypothetical protein